MGCGPEFAELVIMGWLDGVVVGWVPGMMPIEELFGMKKENAGGADWMLAFCDAKVRMSLSSLC